MKRINISSGSTWEEKVGYSRAVKVNNVIEVAGTTATEKGEVVGKNDPYIQTRYILEKIADLLKELGSGIEQVIRTRMYASPFPSPVPRLSEKASSAERWRLVAGIDRRPPLTISGQKALFLSGQLRRAPRLRSCDYWR